MEEQGITIPLLMSDKNLDTQSVCRTCMQLNNLLDLFPNETQSPKRKDMVESLVEIINSCYGIKIKPSDSFSTKICGDCIKLVTLFHTSQRYAQYCNSFLKDESMQQKLRALIISDKSKFEVNVFLDENSEIEEQSLTPNKTKIRSMLDRKEIGTTIDPKNILSPENRREKKPAKSRTGSPVEFLFSYSKKKKRFEKELENHKSKKKIERRGRPRKLIVESNPDIKQGEEKSERKTEIIIDSTSQTKDYSVEDAVRISNHVPEASGEVSVSSNEKMDPEELNSSTASVHSKSESSIEHHSRKRARSEEIYRKSVKKTLKNLDKSRKKIEKRGRPRKSITVVVTSMSPTKPISQSDNDDTNHNQLDKDSDKGVATPSLNHVSETSNVTAEEQESSTEPEKVIPETQETSQSPH